MTSPDPYAGKGGSYVVVNGKRVPAAEAARAAAAPRPESRETIKQDRATRDLTTR